MSRVYWLIFFVGIYLLIISCQTESKKFRLVPPSESGVDFVNEVNNTAEFNIMNYMYFYNGGGVAVGDFNSDQLADIYFTANQQANRLYLNKGNFQFKDITEPAGVKGFDGWATGVTTVDINGDGRLDIYVSYLGDYLIYNGKNQLFINEGNDEQGIPHFTDQAMQYGLDLVGYSTQAAFFDYDRDGDLDMFMLTHSLHQQGTFGKSTRRREFHPLAGDRLLRNDGGRFVDVTKESGIYGSVIGYGLGVAISDVNLDGWLDIYVGNDFHENDYLYINQGNGVFKEQLEVCMNHSSRFSMGVDCADINNDGFPDIITTDMLPSDPQILKSSAAEDPYDVYKFKIGFGYNHQFARNNLQINNQDGTFSEIALQAEVYSTDWSWSALLADFDLDGYKDIYVTNGIPKRPNDLDYINFISSDSIKFKLEEGISNDLEYINRMPEVKIPNVMFMNNHDSTFSDKSCEYGLDQKSYSNGAAYADFDNDGDLDLVVNNINDKAFIYENKTVHEGSKVVESNFIQIELADETLNRFGIGSKVFVYAGGQTQMQEVMPARGFQSSVDYILTFGLSPTSKIDSINVVWSGGELQSLKNVKANQRIKIEKDSNIKDFDYSTFHAKRQLFTKIESNFGIDYQHVENVFNEFAREPLLPHMLSAEGPAIAIGDIDGNGLEDLFLGGAKWQEGRIYLQNANQNFTLHPQKAIAQDSVCEDVDAEFFDADGDNDLDLLVISGGNEFWGTSEFRKPRLYLNDGVGSFNKSTIFPELFLNGSAISLGDIDNDNDLDIFLGSRSIPLKYGIVPDSYLLINQGNGKFADMSQQFAPSLKELGFVKDAVWADLDNDGDQDLIVACEWSEIKILINQSGKLIPHNSAGSGIENRSGWWSAIQAADFDQDGDIDLVVGNLGLNSKLKASESEPVRMYVTDFDKNDSIDQVMTHYLGGAEVPFNTRDELTKQMPFLKKKYLSYQKFSQAGFHDIFDIKQLKNAKVYNATTFETCFVENLGGLKFQLKALPSGAQLSTVNTILVDDLNQDRNPDILLAGNFYPINIQLGRNDASYGLMLSNQGKKFEVIPNVLSGISIKGEVRALKKIRIGTDDYYLAIRNNDSLEIFKLN